MEELKISNREIKSKLSTLWIFVMINILMADIVGFMHPGALESIIKGDVGIEITGELLLFFSFLLEIPIAMIVLSRILKYKLNRSINIVASVITILFVIAGGNESLTYIFFATIEVIAMIYIFYSALKWKEE